MHKKVSLVKHFLKYFNKKSAVIREPGVDDFLNFNPELLIKGDHKDDRPPHLGSRLQFYDVDPDGVYMRKFYKTVHCNIMFLGQQIQVYFNDSRQTELLIRTPFPLRTPIKVICRAG